MINTFYRWLITIGLSLAITSILVLFIPIQSDSNSEFATESFLVNVHQTISDTIETRNASAHFEKRIIDGMETFVAVEAEKDFRVVSKKSILGVNRCELHIPKKRSRDKKFECSLQLSYSDNAIFALLEQLNDSIIVHASLEDNLTDIQIKPITRSHQLYNGNNIWRWSVKGVNSGEMILKVKSQNPKYEFDIIEKIPLVINGKFSSLCSSLFDKILTTVGSILLLIIGIVVDRYLRPLLPEFKKTKPHSPK